jgi:hypothetical protein
MVARTIGVCELRLTLTARSARTAVESNPIRTVLMAAEDAVADFT